MLKSTNQTIATTTKISNSPSRNFAYILSDKKATANLLKSASRDPIEIDEKQRCIIYNLSVGAYIEVIFPLLKEWNTSKVIEKDVIIVDYITTGYDEKGRMAKLRL